MTAPESTPYAASALRQSDRVAKKITANAVSVREAREAPLRPEERLSGD